MEVYSQLQKLLKRTRRISTSEYVAPAEPILKTDKRLKSEHHGSLDTVLLNQNKVDRTEPKRKNSFSLDSDSEHGEFSEDDIVNDDIDNIQILSVKRQKESGSMFKLDDLNSIQNMGATAVSSERGTPGVDQLRSNYL